MKTLILFLISFTATSALCQVGRVTISGKITDKTTGKGLPYVNTVVTTTADSAFVSGTITNEAGQYSLAVAPGTYVLRVSYVGYVNVIQPLPVGKLSEFLDLGEIKLEQNVTALKEVTVIAGTQAVSETMDKKTFSVSENLT